MRAGSSRPRPGSPWRSDLSARRSSSPTPRPHASMRAIPADARKNPDSHSGLRESPESPRSRFSHHHRGFQDDEAGPEPDNPGKPPRVRGDGNTSTGRGIVVPFMGRWAEPSRPGIDAGSPERPRPLGSPMSPPNSLVPEASRCRASAGWLTAGGLKPPPRETPSTGLQPHRAGGGRPAVNGGPARRRQRPVNGPGEARW